MAEEEAKPAEENAEATEAVAADGDAAAEAPAEEAPKPQSVWMPIMASSVVSIAGAFALFHFVLGPKLVSGVISVFDANGTLQAAHGKGADGHDSHEEDGKGGDSHGGGEDSHGGEDKKADPSEEDDSKGEIPIVGEGEAIVINPANSAGMRYLLVDIYLTRADKEDKGFRAAIEGKSKRLQQLTMDKLSERDIQELSNPSVRKQIENDLKLQYARILTPSHPIKDIIIAKWIMQ